jgi:hypothetical protein
MKFDIWKVNINTAHLYSDPLDPPTSPPRYTISLRPAGVPGAMPIVMYANMFLQLFVGIDLNEIPEAPEIGEFSVEWGLGQGGMP